MEINQDFVNANFKDIWVTSTLDGVLVPTILESRVPFEYLPSEYDVENTMEKLTTKTEEKLFTNYVENRIKSIELINKVKINKLEKELNKYLENELKDWIKDYPQFQQIIK